MERIKNAIINSDSKIRYHVFILLLYLMFMLVLYFNILIVSKFIIGIIVIFLALLEGGKLIKYIYGDKK